MHRKLWKNTEKYCGEIININQIIDECLIFAKKFGWRVEILPVLGGHDILVFNRSQKVVKKRVYISAGIHGDEPAGPITILELLKKNEWPENFEISLFPCLNPSGFKKNTRESENLIDLNRDYFHSSSNEISTHINWLNKAPHFDATFCLHEDWESKGFYLYELKPPFSQSIAKEILDSVDQIFPVDRSLEIDGYLSKDGVIDDPLDQNISDYWSEAVYLFKVKKTLNYTFETSSDYALDLRIEAMSRAINTALNILK